METQAFVQPPNKGSIKVWMALNLGQVTEVVHTERYVDNYFYIPGITGVIPLSDKLFFDKVEEIVCDHYGVDPLFLRNNPRRRKTQLVLCRNIVFYFIKLKTKMSLAAIGNRYLKDHATVLHAQKSILNDYLTNKFIKADIQKLSILIGKYRVDK